MENPTVEDMMRITLEDLTDLPKQKEEKAEETAEADKTEDPAAVSAPAKEEQDSTDTAESDAADENTDQQ
jgi:hypothetical protein